MAIFKKISGVGKITLIKTSEVEEEEKVAEKLEEILPEEKKPEDEKDSGERADNNNN